MLEFYPMPTSLNNGGSVLYPHQHPHHHVTTNHHHGTAARSYLENTGNINNNNNNNDCLATAAISSTTTTTSSQGLTINGNNNICGQQPQQHQQQLQHQHQQQHQQLLQMTTTSPAYASCPPSSSSSTSNTNKSNNIISHNNNNNTFTSSSPTISTPAAATTSLTAQIFSNAVTTPQTIAASSVASATNIPLSSSSSSSTSSLSLTLSSNSASASLPSSPTHALTKHPSNSMVMLSTTNSTCLKTPAVAIAAAAATAATVDSASTLSLSTSAAAAEAVALAVAVAAKSSADCNGRTEVGHIKCEKIFEICEGCGQKIHDRYFLNVGDTNWHEQCLACCYCGLQLHHTCYIRNTKPYCKLDYDRLFGIKCAACCHSILPQEMVMRPIPNFIFHLTCFICYACRLPLQKGEQFMLRDGQLFCFRHDIEKEMYLAAAQHCGFVGLDEDELMRPRDGRRGPKRPRTILTSQQRKQFKASFDQSPKPCRKVREALAKDTGLSVRVVQVWFQNQRAKMKKIQRKAKNNGNGTSGGNANGGSNRNGDDKDKDKDEKNIKQESASGSESGYLGLDSSFASQPLNPNLPFSPDDYPANSNDSFCSSDLSLDGSNFDQLDDDADSLSLNNLELQSTGSSGNHNHHSHHHHNNHNHHHHHHHSTPHDLIANLNTSLINPIDKLYLMQNSYFNSEQ